jgi:hypothetical protein
MGLAARGQHAGAILIRRRVRREVADIEALGADRTLAPSLPRPRGRVARPAFVKVKPPGGGTPGVSAL